MARSSHFVSLSRKEMDSLQPPDWAKEAVVWAAEWTAMHGSKHLRRIIQSQLSICGRVAASLLAEGDEPALFVPARIVHNGGDQSGAVLNTYGGAVVVWTEGNFRLTYFGRTIPCAAVQGVEQEPVHPDYNASLYVRTTDGTLTAHFPSAGYQDENEPAMFIDAIVASLRGEGTRKPAPAATPEVEASSPEPVAPAPADEGDGSRRCVTGSCVAFRKRTDERTCPTCGGPTQSVG